MLRVFYNQNFEEQMIIDSPTKVHHLGTVLRVKVGDEVYLVNNYEVAKTKITSVSKKQIGVELINVTKENNELKNKVTLGFGPLKNDNTQLVIQKAVELGVDQIDLVNFKRNVSKFDSTKALKKMAKFEGIIEGACLQSRRNIKPKLNLNVNLNAQYINAYDLVLVCYENDTSNHINKCSKLIKNAKNILVVIGPEGGIDEKEINFLLTFENVRCVNLGKRIMRAETASIASLAIIGSILEEENENCN